MTQYLVIVGALVSLYGIVLYIRDIFRGNTKPNLVTWVLWSIAPIIGSAAAFSDGVRWAVLPTFMVGFGPLLVVIAALIKRNSIWRPTFFDYVCGIFSLLALILWFITKEPALAVFLAILSDGLAALPTLKKAWLFPQTELGLAYLTGLFNILTSFFALNIYTFSELGFPIYNTIINIALCFVIYRKKLLWFSKISTLIF